MSVPNVYTITVRDDGEVVPPTEICKVWRTEGEVLLIKDWLEESTDLRTDVWGLSLRTGDWEVLQYQNQFRQLSEMKTRAWRYCR